nr:response regulator [Anaerolineaceae bacterium]
MQILLVEDDPGILELLKEKCKSGGHTIITAASGEEAFRHLDDESIEIMILDYSLPDMTGHDFIDELNNREIYIP